MRLAVHLDLFLDFLEWLVLMEKPLGLGASSRWLETMCVFDSWSGFVLLTLLLEGLDLISIEMQRLCHFWR